MSDGTALERRTLRGILVLCSARSTGLKRRIPTDLRGWLTESTLRSLISKFSLKIAEFFAVFFQNFAIFARILLNKPQAAPPRFAPRRRGGGLGGICRAEVDNRTAASPRGKRRYFFTSCEDIARRVAATLFLHAM